VIDDRAAWRLVGGIVKVAVQDARRNPDAARWLDDLCSSTGGDWRQAAQPDTSEKGKNQMTDYDRQQRAVDAARQRQQDAAAEAAAICCAVCCGV
jgi:hypothetical protein